MTMVSKKQRRPKLLSSTRPRNCKPRPSLSSHATRNLVRTHHILRKQLSSTVVKGDETGAEAIHAQIEALGGISKYQEASIQGQCAQRGGDTSKVLVEWLSGHWGNRAADDDRGKKLRMLEVGALRTDNACSRSGLFEMERIDLHSQHPSIKKQDLMKRPTPNIASMVTEGFDIVSLSLVVNFVGDPAERGEMLQRVQSFLRMSPDIANKPFPALFLVLPSSCVTNSRYLDEKKLAAMMQSLGYGIVNRKMSAKLVYYLWSFRKTAEVKTRAFKKEELRSGRSRNNFAVVLS